MTAEIQESLDQQKLQVVWCGEVERNGRIVTTIVEDRVTRRRYVWPGLTAWRDPLPSDRPPRITEQLSLFA